MSLELTQEFSFWLALSPSVDFGTGPLGHRTCGGTDYGEQYLRSSPRLETSDERYTWMNQSMFVARGHFLDDSKVEYEVYRVL